jgi:hypothetical protein
MPLLRSFDFELGFYDTNISLLRSFNPLLDFEPKIYRYSRAFDLAGVSLNKDFAPPELGYQ